MDGPFHRGVKRYFTVDEDIGTPTTVRIVMRDPNGTETVYPCSFNATTQKWETTDLVFLGVSGWWERFNSFFSATDTTTPTDTGNSMFQVYNTGLSNPYGP